MVDKNKIKKALSTTFEGGEFALGQKKTGKVRDLYFKGDKVCIIATDRLSAFDRHVCNIPFKGQVLNLLAAFWFEQTKSTMDSHFISCLNTHAMSVKRLNILPIEVIVRGYLTGITATSIWGAYRRGERQFFGYTLKDGLKKNEILPEPLLTPTTKGERDEVLHSVDEMVARGLLTEEEWQKIATFSKRLYGKGQEIAQKCGFILVDTKYEFGKDETGRLFLADELHTPDSSRYWTTESYQNFLEGRGELQHYDKEFIRMWLKAKSEQMDIDLYDRKAKLMPIPDDIKIEMSARYIYLYETLTGKDFDYTDGTVSKKLEAFF